MTKQGNSRSYGSSSGIMKVEAKLRDCLRWAKMRCITAGRPAPQITLSWLLQQWKRQRGRCPIFRIKMEMTGPISVTLDQIEPGKGYTRRNTQLVTKCGNAFKGNMTMQETRRLRRKIAA